MDRYNSPFSTKWFYIYAYFIRELWLRKEGTKNWKYCLCSCPSYNLISPKCSQLMRSIRGIITVYKYTFFKTTHSFTQPWSKRKLMLQTRADTTALYRLHILNEDRTWNLKSDQTATYFQKSNFNRISNHIWISSALLLRATKQIRMPLMYRGVCVGC